MKKISILVASLIALYAGAAFANDYKVGALEIDNPWSRAVPKGGNGRGRLHDHQEQRHDG